MDKVPMIDYWMDKPVTGLSRQELYSAISFLGRDNKGLREQLHRRNIDFVRHMRHQRYMQEFYPTPRVSRSSWLGGFLWGLIAATIVYSAVPKLFPGL